MAWNLLVYNYEMDGPVKGPGRSVEGAKNRFSGRAEPAIHCATNING